MALQFSNKFLPVLHRVGIRTRIEQPGFQSLTSLFRHGAIEQAMQRSLACDVQIALKRMARDREIRICGRNAVPIQIDPCDMDLFDFDQEGVSRDTVAHSRVKDRDYREEDCK